jgi:hypothetical protein
MKTAISLPDPVFAAAEALAGKFKVSRSELYVMALERFIKEHAETDVTRRLNEHIAVYGQPVDEVSLAATIREMRTVAW